MYILYFSLLFIGCCSAMQIPNPAFRLDAQAPEQAEVVLNTTPGYEIIVIDRQSLEEQNAIWSGLIERTYRVMQQGTPLEQDQLFTDVITQMIRSSKNPVQFNDKRMVIRLMHMAVYFKNNNLKNNPRSLWSHLLSDKLQIEAMQDSELKARDMLLIYNLYKHEVLPAHLSESSKRFVPKTLNELMHQGESCEQCLLSDAFCSACMLRIDSCIKNRAMLDCCENKYFEEEGMCSHCFARVRIPIMYQLQQVVLGYHQFGFPLGKGSFKIIPNSHEYTNHLEEINPNLYSLIRWAIFFRSESYKQGLNV